MQLLVVRHGAAVERGTPGVPDDERPLTPDGEKKFRQTASGLRRVLDKPYAILTSPLPRAHRTAEILSEAFEKVALTSTPALAYGTFEDLVSLLKEYPQRATVAIVGHEPSLSELVARLVGGKAGGAFGFKKGGMALVEIDDLAHPDARLVWFLPPKVLRELDK